MNVRQVSRKIKSVGNVKKITKAMQLVSAVKMKKAQAAANDGMAYQKFLEDAIRKISGRIDKNFSPMLKVDSVGAKKRLVILVTSNKGLCGAFNFNVLRFLTQKGMKSAEQVEFVTIGKKGASLCSLLEYKVLADFSSNTPQNNAVAVFEFVLEQYMTGMYAQVSVVYNHFISALRVVPMEQVLLPFRVQTTGERESAAAREYTIEPDPAQIIETLLKNYIEDKIRFSIIESEAGEHSARMMAMKNATDNASEVVTSLTQLKNKLRQQKITYELLDMITAKESVEQT